MRFMVIVKGTPNSEAEKMPPPEFFEAMGKFNEEMAKAGVMLGGEGLHSSASGARLRFDGKQRTVIDGPFTEAKELVAGFWMIQVKSMDEAIEWMKRSPFQDGAVEIRRVFETEEFGDNLAPETRERELRMRAEFEAKA
jgi:hypothetical protein